MNWLKYRHARKQTCWNTDTPLIPDNEDKVTFLKENTHILKSHLIEEQRDESENDLTESKK